MKDKNGLVNYFDSLSDKELTLLVQYNPKGLEQFCILLTLDNQNNKEASDSPKFYC